MEEQAVELPEPWEHAIGAYKQGGVSLGFVRLAVEQKIHAAVLAERERCAKLCETLDHGAFGPPSFLAGVQSGSVGCANAIRKGTK